MRVTVKKDKLIKIIKRKCSEYTTEQISSIIEEHGAGYFNEFTELNIEYKGFCEWEVNI